MLRWVASTFCMETGRARFPSSVLFRRMLALSCDPTPLGGVCASMVGPHMLASASSSGIGTFWRSASAATQARRGRIPRALGACSSAGFTGQSPRIGPRSLDMCVVPPQLECGVFVPRLRLFCRRQSWARRSGFVEPGIKALRLSAREQGRNWARSHLRSIFCSSSELGPLGPPPPSSTSTRLALRRVAPLCPWSTSGPPPTPPPRPTARGEILWPRKTVRSVLRTRESKCNCCRLGIAQSGPEMGVLSPDTQKIDVSRPPWVCCTDWPGNGGIAGLRGANSEPQSCRAPGPSPHPPPTR